MSDRTKSTPPPPKLSELTVAPDPPGMFNEDAALRETYIRNLRPEDQATLATLCGAVLELTREATVFAQAIPYGGLCDQLAAGAAELRWVAAFLAEVGGREGDAISRSEHRLADTAERLAGEVRALAERLEAAIAAVEPEEE